MDSAEQKVEEQEKLETLQPPTQDGHEIEDDKSGREVGNQEGEELSLRDEQSGALQRSEEERPSEVETAGPEDACKEKSQTGVVHPLVSWTRIGRCATLDDMLSVFPAVTHVVIWVQFLSPGTQCVGREQKGLFDPTPDTRFHHPLSDPLLQVFVFSLSR